MKNLAVLLLASLCLFAHATSVYQAPAFLELKKNPLGLALTNMVQVTMQSKQSTGRLDAIDQVLSQVAASLGDQQSTNETNFQIQSGQHQDIISSLTNQLNTANKDLQNYQNESADLTTEQANDETALAHEQSDLESNNGNKAHAELQLEEENSRNDQAVKEYAEAIIACEQSIQLLKTLLSNPAGFVQAKAKFNNVITLLQKHLANKSSPLIAPVISVLAELAASSKEVDQAQLSKIINLINQLLDELRSQEASNVVRHNQTVDELNEQISNLSELISKNKSAIASLQARLQAIADRQSQLVDIIGNLEALIPVIQGQIDSANAQYATQETYYNNVKNELNHDVDALEQVRDYFHVHIATSVQHIDDDVYNDQLSA